jgi:sugar phosphate isomerase/epimerase
MSEFLYCLNTSTIQPAPLLKKIEVASKAGFQAIEPWNSEIDAYLHDGGTMQALRTAIQDAGLKVVSVIALFDWINPSQAARDECCRRMEQAAMLESPYIVASPPPEVVNLDQAAKAYGELIALGRQFRVKPAMEFLGFVSGVKSMAAAWAIAGGSGDADATVVGDVFHMLRGGSTVDDLLMISGDRMAIFHVNDIPAEIAVTSQSDHDRVMVGDGVADLARVIANLRKIKYHGPISLELFNKKLWEQDPLEVAKIGIERLKSLVG